ncbi:ATP-dependent helicase HrpB [Mesorhizobium sp. M6A.T.Cr.TU.014.01.1.1]|uniref:ATP-dependent helicase HrpB n=1 Tax=Mesorhizobium sp. M6A.T.Cr.TU.014.01.1.1 TaxID=2496676 RepID=UPI000FD5F322|nr:ATP-dependent helicase HrpB [Mesorhizobium sp. M6A.T.Cr.TU.014.01.1.1]RVB76943.1 ATP-dependent helicase HrpB [Mesorhizobium sp. M6A.T.Cr.TU.014.01.1.1]
MTRKPLPELPVSAVLPALSEALGHGNSAVLVAPPGAGKTTLVPLALLDAAWLGTGKIILLEPRRLAARAAARRMAELLGEEPGETVGYAMRMENRTSARTRILVVTEGVLSRMILDDPELPGVSAVFFDEFHERSLDGDFGLALALDVQVALRPDLRLLVMSATLDGARVARLLSGAPLIESEGRAFPVDVRYDDRPAGIAIEDAMAKAIRAALAEESGSVLAFLPGQREIERTAERLQGRVSADTDIVPLYGMLDGKAQDAAIKPAPSGRRKVVLATSIAETSITIDGVRVVIDSGLSRLPRYEPASGLTRLETVRVSRASADQRAGRAGRTQPGVAIRLWRAEQTAALPAFTPPEIIEADLSGLLLDCAAFGVADPTSLSFLDPPPAPALNEARSLLRALDAIDEAGRLTEAGAAMRRLALPVRLAHMVAEAAKTGQAFEVGADLQGKAQNARITAAAAIDETDIRASLADKIETRGETSFDRDRRAVRVRETVRLGAITLSERMLPAPAGTEADHAILDALRQHGLSLLPWGKEAETLRQRLGWLHRGLGAPWPDVSDAALIDSLDDWLLPYLSGAASFAAIDPGVLSIGLMALVPHDLQRRIEALAPTHFDAPSGSRVPIRYDGEWPVLAIRVQELFGLDRHPSIANGTVPLTLELLSPAHRPIQTTRDLPGFWRGSWADVRADMRGRYPRHVWPENPLLAAATSRAKPRGS